MKTRIVCALLLALMLLALAGCGKKEDHPQPEDPNVTQEEEAVPVHLVCSNGSITLRFSLEEGHWLWADDKTFPLDESYALALLETVQGIESLPPVTTAAQLADYGLDSPTKYVTVTDSQGASVTYRLGRDNGIYIKLGLLHRQLTHHGVADPLLFTGVAQVRLAAAQGIDAGNADRVIKGPLAVVQLAGHLGHRLDQVVALADLLEHGLNVDLLRCFLGEYVLHLIHK